MSGIASRRMTSDHAYSASDASSPTPGDGFSLSLEPGLTGAAGFLKLVSFLRRDIAIRS